MSTNPETTMNTKPTPGRYCVRVTIPGSKIQWRVIPSRGFVEGQFKRADGSMVYRRPTEQQRRAALSAAGVQS